MRTETQAELQALEPDLERFKRWKPDAQAKALDRLRQSEHQRWRPFYCTNRLCNGQPHCWPIDERDCPSIYGHEWVRDQTMGDEKGEVILDDTGHVICSHCEVKGQLLDGWSFTHARADQWPPRWKDDWLTLFMRGGRGSGKTKTGSEITNNVTRIVSRITLIGATGPDFRTHMIEGDSGILACSPPGQRPVWEPSKKQLTWPNGCIGEGYSAEEPERLRGQNSQFVWADEPAHWKLVRQCWDNMLFGLRIGQYPKVIATSTPKPTEWVKETLAEDTTIDRVVSTYANTSNLSPVYRKQIITRFEGTRTGRQELYGEVLEDVEGALWKWEMIQYVTDAPDLQRIVVAVDPAGTANKRSDLTGIIVVGIGHDKNLYVLGDYTGRFSPEQWGRTANDQYVSYHADAIVLEKNYGADMVRFVLENTLGKASGLMPRIIPVTSRRGKDIRAEPIVALYEKKRVFHVGERGSLEKLDDEMCTWVPHEGPSPNRVDALVHGITNLAKDVMPSSIANPSVLLRGLGFGTHRGM